MIGNGLATRVERLIRVLERVSDPRVLITAMILSGAAFWWYGLRVHDAKLDAMLLWTAQKTAFDFLDCVRESANEKMERLCEQARAGHMTTLTDVRIAAQP